jgi:hypothetical protein
LREIPNEAIDMIVFFQVVDEKTYMRKYSSPTWGGLYSGVEIGFGYDLGYVNIK